MRADATRAAEGRCRAASALALTLILALLAGCGGDSEEDVSRSDFIAEADAVCTRYAAESDVLEGRFNQALAGGDLEAAAQDFQDQASQVTAMLDELAGLTPPLADQTTMDQFVALGRERVEVAEQAASAIASGDKEAMISAGREASLLAGQYFQRAESFGFEACGSSPDPAASDDGGAGTAADSTEGAAAPGAGQP